MFETQPWLFRVEYRQIGSDTGSCCHQPQVMGLRDFIQHHEAIGTRRDQYLIVNLEFHQMRSQLTARHLYIIDFKRPGTGCIAKGKRPPYRAAIYLQTDLDELAGLERLDLSID